MPDLEQLDLFDAGLPAADRNVAPIGRRHPDTARAAGERALPRSGSKRRLTVDAIAVRPSTAEEIGDRFGWPHQSYSATVSTLVRDGWLEPDGTATRPTSTGNDAIVWRLTGAALTARAAAAAADGT